MRKRTSFDDSIPKETFSEKGFGLVEVMVAAAIISIIALGIATLIDDMLKMQKKSNTVGVITRLKEQIIAAAQNGRSWELTVADVDAVTGNPDLACLTSGTLDCNDAATGPLNLKDIENNPLYYARTANHGFTLQGAACTTYPSVECPFRWNLTYEFDCPGAAATCKTPDVRIIGLLQYTEATVTLPGGFNPELYRVDIRRGSEAIRNDGLTVSYIAAGTLGEGTGCHLMWFRRQFNTVENDPGNNVVNKSGTTLTGGMHEITLRPGTYNCRVHAPAFKSGGNRLRLVTAIDGTDTEIISSTSSTASVGGGSANLTLETTLVLSVETEIRIEQRCQFLPSSNGFWAGSPAPIPPGYDIWQLGVPTPDTTGAYTGTTYTKFSCARTS